MTIIATITNWPEAAVYMTAWAAVGVVGFAFCRYVIGDSR